MSPMQWLGLSETASGLWLWISPPRHSPTSLLVSKSPQLEIHSLGQVVTLLPSPALSKFSLALPTELHSPGHKYDHTNPSQNSSGILHCLPDEIHTSSHGSQDTPAPSLHTILPAAASLHFSGRLI